MTDLIKCAFCDYKTPRFTTKGGKLRHGWNRLNNHIQIEHPDKWMEVQERLMEAYPADSNFDEFFAEAKK